MESVSAIHMDSEAGLNYTGQRESNSVRGTTTEAPSILGWYRILRAQYHWPLFQAIRYALWLAR